MLTWNGELFEYTGGPSAKGYIPPPQYVSTLLSHFDGTDGATTYTSDIGSNVFTFKTGALISGNSTKFGLTSLYLGSSYITTPSTTDLKLGSGNFTLECWFNTALPTTSQMQRFAAKGDLGSLQSWCWGIGSAVGGTSRLDFAVRKLNNTVQDFYANSLNVISGTWYHIALVKNNGSILQYFNGSMVNISAADHPMDGGVQPFIIGCRESPPSSPTERVISMNIDEFRIIKGTAVYTGSTYTIPLSPFTS